MKLRSVLARTNARLISVAPADSVRDAIALLTEHDIGCVLVLDEAGGLAGILSERDIVRATPGGDVLSEPVSALMTSDVVYGHPDDDLESVLATMTSRHFRHLPVIDGGSLVGIVSIGDVVQEQLDNLRGTVENLQIEAMES